MPRGEGIMTATALRQAAAADIDAMHLVRMSDGEIRFGLSKLSRSK